ncbi:MAG: phosphoketolase, partial [Herminiimonas sp.]|nr:phosphoketolase [Herminiimonas sp.]
GAVLPILHMNGYKIAGPTILARLPREELEALFKGYGYMPYFVEGSDPEEMHQRMAAALDEVVDHIQRIQIGARYHGVTARPHWPMIIFRSPKGWTGPKEVDGKPVEGTFRSHQVPMGDMKHPGHVKILENWMKSYRPEELFDGNGKLRPELAALAPKGQRRMGANPHANGGVQLQELRLPEFSNYAVNVERPGCVTLESTRIQGMYMRDVIRLNEQNFRIFSPDETNSNRWNPVFEVTNRVFAGEILPNDEHVSPDGRVMEVLSEHQCQGWLEGYLLTGRHGFFSCYEAFIHIVDSMFNQHAKWLNACNHIPWRKPVASLNYLLSSHVWRQDHNGSSHQDPGFIDHVLNKKAEIVRVYLPPDANTLLSVTEHCLKSRNYVNVIISGKQPEAQWLDMDAAIKHCTSGIGIWEWASSSPDQEPDVVLACAGDVPTLETLAAARLLREFFPGLKVRVINVVDLMKLQPSDVHPHGLCDADFDGLFTKDKPVIFAYHGYPSLIHRLTYKRFNHANFHVHGFREEGTTTTPFDICVLNGLDRFCLFNDAIARIPDMAAHVQWASQFVQDKYAEHRKYIEHYGDDMPEIRNWQW